MSLYIKSKIQCRQSIIRSARTEVSNQLLGNDAGFPFGFSQIRKPFAKRSKFLTVNGHDVFILFAVQCKTNKEGQTMCEASGIAAMSFEGIEVRAAVDNLKKFLQVDFLQSAQHRFPTVLNTARLPGAVGEKAPQV